jgi:hypothetical protein
VRIHGLEEEKQGFSRTARFSSFRNFSACSLQMQNRRTSFTAQILDFSVAAQFYPLLNHARDIILKVFKANAQPFGIFLGHALLHKLTFEGFPRLADSSVQSSVHPDKARRHSNQVRSRLRHFRDN